MSTSVDPRARFLELTGPGKFVLVRTVTNYFIGRNCGSDDHATSGLPTLLYLDPAIWLASSEIRWGTMLLDGLGPSTQWEALPDGVCVFLPAAVDLVPWRHGAQWLDKGLSA